ncbi:hypothetical protein FOL47_009176 [Perkinsus chesapeaki]|uniref:Uncharacterized protein n=1 Tax=Perkinsus chesapeaki TaxID=330153 RepID=A0A7J6LA51_PERCH|nr:hypothetical protein FOL47_009176 [Perkinsus chesapeaki]
MPHSHIRAIWILSILLATEAAVHDLSDAESSPRFSLGESISLIIAEVVESMWIELIIGTAIVLCLIVSQSSSLRTTLYAPTKSGPNTAALDAMSHEPCSNNMVLECEHAPSVTETVTTITRLTGSRFNAAVFMYRRLIASGELSDLLGEVSQNAEDVRASITEMLSSLCLAAVRVCSSPRSLREGEVMTDSSGNREERIEVEEVLRDMVKLGLDIPIDTLISITKMCTSKHLYKKCLWIHRKLLESELGLSPVLDKTINSCLLLCAVEAKDLEICELYFDRLKSTVDGPSPKDLCNMVKCYAYSGEADKAVGVIQSMRETGLPLDVVTCNSVISGCVNRRELDMAESLLDEMAKPIGEGGEEEDRRGGGAADVVTYNTVMKGHARIGDVIKCAHLMKQMKSQEIFPTVVTYGIFLDCCINAGDMSRAKKVFQEMRQRQNIGGSDQSDGFALNTVMYTTLIKGHAKDGQVDAAMTVYDEMKNCGVAPDLITFSILIKVNCDCGRANVSLGLLKEMLDAGFDPDEIIFNNLLLGCCTPVLASLAPFKERRQLASAILAEMKRRAVSGSSATFSILMKVIFATIGDQPSQSTAEELREKYNAVFEECLNLLDVKMEEEYGVIPELRLYTQLAQQAIRQRNGGVTLRICGSMIGRHMRNLQPDHPQPSVPKSTANTRNLAPRNRVDVINRQTVETLLGSAVTCGLLETAVQLVELFIKFKVSKDAITLTGSFLKVINLPDEEDPLIAKLRSMMLKKPKGDLYVSEMKRIVAAYSSDPAKFTSVSTVYQGISGISASQTSEEGEWKVIRNRKRFSSNDSSVSTQTSRMAPRVKGNHWTAREGSSWRKLS